MVFSTLFKDSNTQKLKEIEVFSTTKVAINWLNLNVNENEIHDILTTFRNHAKNKQVELQ
jgi:inosine/xanthosine triphosphate pyrophosphatase family protein